jgi:hypothetical protein
LSAGAAAVVDGCFVEPVCPAELEINSAFDVMTFAKKVHVQNKFKILLVKNYANLFTANSKNYRQFDHHIGHLEPILQ